MKRGPLFYAQLAFTLLVCAFLVVPMVLSVMAGVTTNYFIGIKSGLTVKWIIEVWTLYHKTLFLSLGIAVACVIVTALIGVPAAYVLARNQGRAARLVEELIVLPVAVPGLATALALIQFWGGITDFRTSWVFILIGHVVFTLPFMVRPVLALMLTGGLRDLEEAAATLGAGFAQRFFTVVLPNVRGGVLAGALMVLTLSVGEFNITWMLHTPLTMTLPVGLADSYASMRLEIGSAYTIIFFLIIIPLLLAMQYWSDFTNNARKHRETTPRTSGSSG
jgi:putative spermidine/putrescine transport system permease protein